MSSQNQFNLLIDFCLKHGHFFVPSKTGDGEPWFKVTTISIFTGREEKTVRKYVSQLSVKPHPAFNGFFKFSDFEVPPDEETKET